MAQKVNLTPERIGKHTCPPGKTQVFLWDKRVAGLGVRVTSGGSRVFIFQSRLDGKTIRVKIGPVSAWLLDNPDDDNPGARQEAIRLAGLVGRGIDPRIHKQEKVQETRQKQLAARREEITLAEVWPLYIEERSPYWGERHRIDHERLAQPGGEPLKRGKGKTKPGPLVKMMPHRLVDLTPEIIREWVLLESKTRKTAARQAVEALRTFARWCEDEEAYQGLIPDGAFNGKVKQVTPKRNAKSDTLQKEQLSAWFDAVRNLDSPTISAYLQALVLTGARRGEMATLTWDNLNFKWQSMTIRDKVVGERTIPLTPYLAALLTALPRRNEFVFSSPTSKTGHIEEPRRPHNRALAVAGLEGLTIHGLRRSFSNLSEWVETPVGIVYQIMGHAPSATAEKHYKSRPLDLLRKWHVKIEKFILDEAGIKQPTVKDQTVVDIRQAEAAR